MVSLPTVVALDAVAIPITCPVPWDSMHGDHRTRFCDQCRQNVHDVSELTRAEAVELVTGGEEMPCLRLYRRQDGRVMTTDCMTRRERVWKWLHKRAPWAAAAFAMVFLQGCNPFCYAGAPTTHPRSQADGTAVQSVVGGTAAVEKPAAATDR